jgi:malonyl-CoA/methylmalonyl-CoA synthetase
MNAHDADGFFKTGDIAQRIGPYYYILGRASVDIIKSGGYKISALDIEREILGLPYISEVMVVGIDDDEFGQRVAAAITLLDGDMNTGSLTLERLRTDLRGTLAGYKMPTLLRVVPELPKTVTGKVMKKVLRPQMFPAEGHPDVQVWKKAGFDAPRL